MGSETNGGAKKNNHALIASLIKDTMLGIVQDQENKVQNEVLTLVEELGIGKNSGQNSCLQSSPKRDSGKVCDGTQQT